MQAEPLFPCAGKEAFASPQQAQKARGKSKRLASLAPYKCASCALWHLGRPKQPIHQKAIP